MFCKNIDECYENINLHFNGNTTGFSLIVNTDSYDNYQEIVQRLEADGNKKCIYVSDNCPPNGLPNIEDCKTQISQIGSYVLIGVSQALQLRGAQDLERTLDELVGFSISGHVVILLEHCKFYLQKLLSRDLRLKKRILLVDGSFSRLPQIIIVNGEEYITYGSTVYLNIKRLLEYLEKINDIEIKESPCIYVASKFDISVFRQAIYTVTAWKGIYASLVQNYPELVGYTEINYGNEERWTWLAGQMVKYKTLYGILSHFFHATNNLIYLLEGAKQDGKLYWLLWLGMKIYDSGNDNYISYVLRNSICVEDFEEHIYKDLLDYDYDNERYNEIYRERKHIIEKMPENLVLVAGYCGQIGKKQENAIFYITDGSEQEKFEFIRCLSIYDYSDKKLLEAISLVFPDLAQYMKKFRFDEINTKLSDKDSYLRDELSLYFEKYKLQKLTNRVFPDFVKKVEEYALSRPYYKLRPRSSVVSQMDKNNVEVFFFDALGVEYLAYIQAKCEEYGLIAEFTVARGELPSITVKNKEFLQFFPNGFKKIDDLDEVKHHSQIYNYAKRKEPIHIFRELEIIDTELRRIQSLLVQESIEKAIIISDHGASRLAVINNQETDDLIVFDEKGEHSGRCCPVESDPQLPFAAYEDGYSVLANYDRFKGGRKANVEVHGGATLEEVLVPIITLMKRPDKLEICFVDSLIKLKQKDVAEIILYSNMPLRKPKILVTDKFYEGIFLEDNKHVKFSMPEIKRSREYVANVYDGEKNLSVCLKFRIQKATGMEIDFNLN